MVKKLRGYIYIYNHLHTIPACDRQTDRQTSCHGIVCAMHTRRVVNTKNFNKQTNVQVSFCKLVAVAFAVGTASTQYVHISGFVCIAKMNAAFSASKPHVM